ncbi:uncharacterized protein LOC62_07G009822 [Vanrija pseudolonga]|uniref:Uncharacterized protein n=1 Tax=Vanrija pseudolonga TaxID=143232 RepID=A0AAF0YKZ1_9TREE|nr:hypothetical protein LOC62_07G009822 [Vanrija pseudolonga]
MAKFTNEAGAALAFGILYAAMWLYMAYMYATKQYKWKSRFTILFFHATLRVASQGCGIAFGILAWSNVNVFVAYLILGAEGYFSLTIASYYFLHHYLLKHFGSSRLIPLELDKMPAADRRKRAFMLMAMLPVVMPWKFWQNDLMAIIDSWLIPANAIIIAGGSMMAGAMDPNSSQYKGLTPEQIQAKINHKLDVSKALRTTGQAIFLALTVIFGVFVLHTLRRGQRHGGITKTIILFVIVAIMLHVRGIFGVLQAAVYSLSYYNPANFAADGLTHRFTALEYCLAVLPEFSAALALNISWRTSAIEAPIKQHGLPDPEDGHVLSAKRTDDESRVGEDEPKP